MKKIGLIAWREFTAAVFNRGFIVGLLMMPILGVLFAAVAPRVFMPRPIRVAGDVLMVDRAGTVAAELRKALDPAALTARRQNDGRRVLANVPQVARSIGGSDRILEQAMGPVAAITVIDPPTTEDPIEQGKAWIKADSPGSRHLAMVVVHENALTPEAGGAPAYDIYVPSGLDGRVEGIVHDGMREAIISARVQAQQIDRTQMEALLSVTRPTSTTVFRGQERQTAGGFNVLLPIVLAGLMVFGVMVGGQTLLTSTIEEKSSRVIEVLLSAASPFELMAGKIIGQLAVSLLVLLVYAGLGLLLLVSFALIGLLDPWLILYLLGFFLVTYVFFGAVFATAGAAVNDMKEAQTLMGPVMLVLMGPWIVAFPISRDPDSTMAVVLSFVPPVNSFVMMLRLASTTPPPAWQALLSLAIGVAASCAATWFAAKVFRIGLLMHGKPPNLATLLRWARSA